MRYVFRSGFALALGLLLSIGCGTGEGQVFPCTEQGIRDAIAHGGGTHSFDCDGPATVVTRSEIVIDNDVILDGEGNLTVDGNERHRVFRVAKGITAELRGFTVTKGFSAQESGGGIYIYNGRRLTLTNSTVSGNSSTSGGGISNMGGVFDRAGRLTLTNSTVSGNTASRAGGGIANQGTLTLTNSTVSGNAAAGVNGGGGIWNFNEGTVTLTNSTVSGNSSAYGGGGIDTVGKVTLTNTLVVNNDCAGNYFSSGGGNIESPGGSCRLYEPTDLSIITAEQLNLGPLQDNGGPTMTHALGEGSVAIDVIPEGDCVNADGQPLLTDQRREPRPVAIVGPEPKCDIGAFEVQGNE